MIARVDENGTPTYQHTDLLGSPVTGTDATGAVTWRERYTPYGEKLLKPAVNDNHAGFTGHIDDSATGLTYMQARYYDPNIGRFLSNVKPTHGVPVFDNADSVSSRGFVPHEVDLDSVPPNLQIIQRGQDKSHFEITPKPGANLSPEKFQEALDCIKCK